MSRLQLACWALLLQAGWAHTVGAQGHSLRIESPNNADAPKVLVGDTAKVPTLDRASGKWSVPIDPAPPNFVTSYLISSVDGSVVALQLSIPGRILSSNQLVYLVPPSIKVVDELAIRKLWSANEIVASPSDPRIQFRYLQDLVHINDVIMRRYADSPRLDAMTLRSAFMLFQVVRNLAVHTWYVIDPRTQTVIDYARQTLLRGEQQGKTCDWLSRAICRNKGVPNLLAAVQSLNSGRFTRMYENLIPPRTALTTEFCDGELSRDLRAFLTFLHDANESGGSQSINESRVVNDIAACETRLALCRAESTQAAIDQLGSVKELLEKFKSPQTRLRLVEVERTRKDLMSGKPAVCPP